MASPKLRDFVAALRTACGDRPLAPLDPNAPDPLLSDPKEREKLARSGFLIDLHPDPLLNVLALYDLEAHGLQPAEFDSGAREHLLEAERAFLRSRVSARTTPTMIEPGSRPRRKRADGDVDALLVRAVTIANMQRAPGYGTCAAMRALAGIGAPPPRSSGRRSAFRSAAVHLGARDIPGHDLRAAEKAVQRAAVTFRSLWRAAASPFGHYEPFVLTYATLFIDRAMARAKGKVPVPLPQDAEELLRFFANLARMALSLAAAGLVAPPVRRTWVH